MPTPSCQGSQGERPLAALASTALLRDDPYPRGPPHCILYPPPVPPASPAPHRTCWKLMVEGGEKAIPSASSHPQQPQEGSLIIFKT